ncbi:Ku protein [Methanobacterium spitsbergense]|uniref:DNA-binding protein n=1 Tax=Methanobacterium spitsbergense TaxID=2874285 RepID=A0A8T5UTK6_9EURY|nr:Ku protein [Methanobacterium spitsbergense]MBZ2165296.1 DNA-binding protein [Methanobacterium spitsbergense]
MRSIWSGYLSFGSILIPVRQYAASGTLHVSFHQVHKTDCGRVRYKKVCEKDGEELNPEDIIKAYIVGGECLKFTDEELDSLKPFSTKIMEILGFCNIKEIPMEALNKPYYLGTDSPKKGGAGKSFLLLKESMNKSNKVAVVKWVSRTNEYLGMLQPYEKGLLLKQLLYHEQVKPIEEVEVLDAEVEDDLVDKGVKAIEKMTFKFDWSKYTETYTQEVKELVERKFIGEEVVVGEFKVPETRSIEAELEKMLEE